MTSPGRSSPQRHAGIPGEGERSSSSSSNSKISGRDLSRHGFRDRLSPDRPSRSANDEDELRKDRSKAPGWSRMKESHLYDRKERSNSQTYSARGGRGDVRGYGWNSKEEHGANGNRQSAFYHRQSDSGWGSRGKAKASVSAYDDSLERRLEPRQAPRREGSDEEEEEEARVRRIRRLKRRRRSAGLDSDIDESELLESGSFGKSEAVHDDRDEDSRSRRSRNGDRPQTSYNWVSRQGSVDGSERGSTRERTRSDWRDNGGNDRQTAKYANDRRGDHRKELRPKHDRRDIDPPSQREDRWGRERKDRSSRYKSSWRDEERSLKSDDSADSSRHRRRASRDRTDVEVSRPLTNSPQPDRRSERGGREVKAYVRREQSPDARILRRRRSCSRSPRRRREDGEHRVERHSHSERDRTRQRESSAEMVVSKSDHLAGHNGLSSQGESKTLASREVGGTGIEVVQGIEAAHSATALLSRRARPDEVYERIAQVGEGTYGQVFKARSDRTGVIVALKKIRMESEKDGFPITAMREVKLLQGLRHENVVRLHEMMLSKHSIYMVFEYLQHDLNGILSQPSIVFTSAHLKSLAAQLLAGLAYLHKHSILHRDLKCSNLLLDNEGTLKLADFGLARSYTKQIRAPRKRTLDYTNRVVTLWYRAPELLFGETSYGDAIDVWGAGCIFLELFARKPVFQGQDEIHQVQLLFELLGPVEKDEWPEADGLPWYDLVRPTLEQQVQHNGTSTSHKQRLRALLGEEVPADALDVAVALLTYNTQTRVSAQDALEMPYFARNDPAPQKPAALLQAVEGEWHEFESRRARRDAAAQALHAHVHREKEEKQRLAREAAVQEKGLRSELANPAYPTLASEVALLSATGTASEPYSIPIEGPVGDDGDASA